MGKGIIVVGTASEVGKTYVASLLVKNMKKYGFHTGYYKVCSSRMAYAKLEQILPEDIFVSYLYRTQAAPHIAAMMENKPIERAKINDDFAKLSQTYDFLCVESNSGMMCPLKIGDSETLMMTDIIKDMGAPIILVSSLLSDKINHLLLSIQYARSKHLPLKGVILNRYNPQSAFCQDKLKEIEEVLDVPIICVVEENAQSLPLSRAELIRLFE